jgi:hypothetical protein
LSQSGSRSRSLSVLRDCRQSSSMVVSSKLQFDLAKVRPRGSCGTGTIVVTDGTVEIHCAHVRRSFPGRRHDRHERWRSSRRRPSLCRKRWEFVIGLYHLGSDNIGGRSSVRWLERSDFHDRQPRAVSEQLTCLACNMLLTLFLSRHTCLSYVVQHLLSPHTSILSWRHCLRSSAPTDSMEKIEDYGTSAEDRLLESSETSISSRHEHHRRQRRRYLVVLYHLTASFLCSVLWMTVIYLMAGNPFNISGARRPRNLRNHELGTRHRYSPSATQQSRSSLMQDSTSRIVHSIRGSLDGACRFPSGWLCQERLRRSSYAGEQRDVEELISQCATWLQLMTSWTG